MSVGPTRVAAPWKCSSSIALIGDVTVLKRSIMASIAASGSPARKFAFQ